MSAVVVTGAASGIGAAVASRLRQGGADVIGVDVHAADDVRLLDVTDRDQWDDLAADLAETGVAGFANCAGITRRPRLSDVTREDMLAAFDVNVVGPLLGIQALESVFVPGASIVNIGSIAALTGHYPVAYTASKWALRGLTHAAALDLGPKGFRINLVHPGFIETPMTASASDAFRDSSVGETSVGRAGTPDEVATVVEFLLGDGSTYLNGSEISVDGGATSHGGVKSISDALARTEHP